MNSNYLKLYGSCRIVKGKRRSVICDLHKNRFEFIPNSLSEIFDDLRTLNIHKAKKNISESDLTTFESYIDFLLKHEFVFECSKEEIDNFPDISLDFDYPAHLSNAVIDFDINSKHDFSIILKKFLIPSLCRNVQFRFYNKVSLNNLNELLLIISDSFIKSVDFVIKYSDENDSHEISKIVNDHKKIRSLILHSAIDNKIIQSESNGRGFIASIKENINSSVHCGVVHSNYFTSNIESFTESLNFNSCLNRKIGIDIHGNIKNCPSMPEHYGNVKDTSLEEVLIKPGFKKYWGISKNQIDVCKDCEFRYICRDCRAYTERSSFSEQVIDLNKPLKCGYDPYTNKWEDWSNNPLKQKAIEFYSMQDFLKDDD